MSYCVHCGVELADSEKRCPLCHTRVVDPASPEAGQGRPPYPRYEVITPERVSKRSVLLVMALIFLVPICLVVVCDLSLHARVTWAGFVMGALLCVYVFLAGPILSVGRWYHAATLCVAADAAVVLGYLRYIERTTGGHWFADFAAPVVLLAALSVGVAILLRQHAGATRLMVAAVAVAEAGVFCLVLELMLIRAFGLRDKLVWSLYPLVTAEILAILLAVIDRTPALKEKLGRKFFL